MKLLIVIVNYKVTELAIACLQSLAQEIDATADAKVVVVENSSGEDAETCLRHAIAANSWDAWADLLPGFVNLGFSGANNLVIRKALATADPPRYVMLLNPDTIVQPGSISALVRFMDERPEIGIAGSRLEYPGGGAQGTPFRFQGIASEFDRGAAIGLVSRILYRWSPCLPKSASACPVDWVAGAAMIIRRQVFEEVGLLDEGYFIYFEDMDYCLNARRAGWPTWYVPQSLIVHVEGSSSGVTLFNRIRLPEYWFQARRRFFLKNYGKIYAVLADGAFIAGSVLCRLRHCMGSGTDRNPRWVLHDSIRHSVFFTGFRLENRESTRGGASL